MVKLIKKFLYLAIVLTFLFSCESKDEKEVQSSEEEAGEITGISIFKSSSYVKAPGHYINFLVKTIDSKNKLEVLNPVERSFVDWSISPSLSSVSNSLKFREATVDKQYTILEAEDPYFSTNPATEIKFTITAKYTVDSEVFEASKEIYLYNNDLEGIEMLCNNVSCSSYSEVALGTEVKIKIVQKYRDSDANNLTYVKDGSNPEVSNSSVFRLSKKNSTEFLLEPLKKGSSTVKFSFAGLSKQLTFNATLSTVAGVLANISIPKQQGIHLLVDAKKIDVGPVIRTDTNGATENITQYSLFDLKNYKSVLGVDSKTNDYVTFEASDAGSGNIEVSYFDQVNSIVKTAEISFVSTSPTAVINDKFNVTAKNSFSFSVKDVDSLATNQRIYAVFDNNIILPDLTTCSAPNCMNIGANSSFYSSIELNDLLDGGKNSVRLFIAYGDESVSQVASRTITKWDKIDSMTKDPFAKNQWILHNMGDTDSAAFAKKKGRKSSATVFSDLNVKKIYENYGLSGKGVKVLIVGDGMDYKHPDLEHNFSAALSKNYNANVGESGENSYNVSVGASHGTSIAGIIAAEYNNGIGIMGIAPKAKIGAKNYLNSNQDIANEIDSISTMNADIINMSYNTNPTSVGVLSPSIREAYENGITNGRGGKGIIYIKSAGNGFNGNSTICPQATTNNTSCAITGFEAVTNLPYIMVIAAQNSKGWNGFYSNVGGNLWVTGFGGENGHNYNGEGVNTESGNYPYPAIITTDIVGCTEGYSRKYEYANISNPTTLRKQLYWRIYISSFFNFGMANDNDDGATHPDNTLCNYTSTFYGTSPAAATVSGVTALMLQANPKLTWRDVKHILAKTARKASPGMVNTQLTGGFISKQGWITNKAEPDAFHYNNIYGFGVIDANKAVEMALKYSKEDTEKLGQFISHTFNFSGNITIPDNKSSGATVRSVNSKEMIAEEVQVKLSIEHANSSDLAIWLKSPKGTSHQVIPRGSKTNGNYVNILFTSNAFYGEEAKGEWEIKAVDGNAGEAGHLSSASIIIYGHTK